MVILDGDPFEVATFRADAPYVDGRRPSSVRFGTIEEDAKRRDFTIGGMYYDPFEDRLIDLVGGMRDLRAGIIRAIGNPYDRFAEDHLRVMRAARFAARLNFTIEPETHAAMKLAAPMVPKVSAERIGEEIVRLMTEGGAARGMDIMVETGLMKEVLPEVLPMIGCEQPANYHPEGDVYVHTKIAVAMLSPGCAETPRVRNSFSRRREAADARRAERQGHLLRPHRDRRRDGDRHPYAVASFARGAGTRRIPREKSSEADDGAAHAHLDAQADARGGGLRRAARSLQDGRARLELATSATITCAAARWRR